MSVKKNKIRYVGSFPPPYGGVTIKNELLYRCLGKRFDIVKPNNNSSLSSLMWFIGSIFSKQKMIVGVSSVNNKSLLITKALYYFNRKRMKQSLYFMMGGLESSRIAKNKKEIQMYSQYKAIFVETIAMKTELENIGMTNIRYYPNCRQHNEMDCRYTHDGFKCVFFSFVSPEKGVCEILNVAKCMPYISFDFYGEIEPTFKESFMSIIKSIPNAKYCGIFKAEDSRSIYQKLSEYDVLLLPSHWKNEGVPGVLIESKLAGVPAIVTNTANKSSIVHHFVDGIVIDDSENALKAAIEKLAEDNLFLNNLSNGAKDSSKTFIIDNYLPLIESLLI